MCESTVKVHVRHIMKKLRAKNRTDVAIKATALLACSRCTTQSECWSAGRCSMRFITRGMGDSSTTPVEPFARATDCGIVRSLAKRDVSRWARKIIDAGSSTSRGASYTVSSDEIIGASRLG